MLRSRGESRKQRFESGIRCDTSGADHWNHHASRNFQTPRTMGAPTRVGWAELTELYGTDTALLEMWGRIQTHWCAWTIGKLPSVRIRFEGLPELRQL